MRNQNPKHKLDQAVTLLKTAVWLLCDCFCDVSVYFIRESKGRWSVIVLILHLSGLGAAPCWGVHLQKKGDEMKRFWRWWTGLRRRGTLPRSQPGQLRGSQLSSKSALVQRESHWCHDIVLNYETTSSCSSVHPLPPFLKSTALQPGVSATGRSKYARLFKELVIFIWNWPGRNGEGCQIVGTPVPVFPGTDPSGSLFLVYHQLLSCS